MGRLPGGDLSRPQPPLVLAVEIGVCHSPIWCGAQPGLKVRVDPPIMSSEVDEKNENIHEEKKKRD